MIKTSQPALHGDQHLPTGSDPIPGLSLETPGTFTDWVLNLPGVWGYWPLQEASGDAIDQGPTGADLQPIGTPAYQATGPNSSDLPYAVRLTGARQSTITDDSFYDTADVLDIEIYDDLTAMCWIKPDSASTIGWPLPIIGNWDTFRTGWFLYIQETTRQLVWASGNNTTANVLVGPPITMDTWSLVAVTRTASGDVKLYVNGAEVDSDTGLTAFTNLTGHGIRIGAVDLNNVDPDAYHFYGNMAGAVFVDHALTGGEILDAYNAATSGGGGGGVPSGSAGGVLDGTYPDPGLNASVAGAGLTEASDVLSVNVDASTIEINSDTLRVKADGVTANEIAAGAVGSSELASTAVAAATYGDATHVGQFTVDADGRLTAAANVAVTAPAAARLIRAYYFAQMPTSLPASSGMFRVPYLAGSSVTFTLSRATLHLETAGSTTTTLLLEKSTTAGVFTAVLVATLTLGSGANDVTVTSSLGSLSSGDLFRWRWTALGTGAQSFYAQLEGTV